MAHSYNHAISSVRRFGGTTDDYIEIHSWLDASKEFVATFRHRALRHHAQGIFEAERLFGVTITNSSGKPIPTRLIAERHVIEDCGFIPTLEDWLGKIPAEDWMHRAAGKRIVDLPIDPTSPPLVV